MSLVFWLETTKLHTGSYLNKTLRKKHINTVGNKKLFFFFFKKKKKKKNKRKKNEKRNMKQLKWIWKKIKMLRVIQTHPT